MSEAKGKVSVLPESISIRGKRLGESILDFDNELSLADYSGVERIGPCETTSYSLLLGNKRLYKWRLFRRRRPRIADISILQSKDKRWLMTVYGIEHVKRAESLAEFLAAKFGVEIHVRLESELPKREMFFQDWGD